MEIKQLKVSDSESLVKIRLESLRNNPEAYSSSYEEVKVQPLELHESRLQSQESFTFGAFDEEQLIGTVALVKENRQKLRHRANIVSMYVIPTKRRLGVGMKLLQAAIEKARILDNIEQLHLTVASENKSAVQLYAQAGFEEYGTEKKALKIDNNYVDVKYMVLYL
ncbi:GNAT family N-acetyltransferase [Ornithinibacillus sp. L9]|uniref:GNAT family N-acetyltransferase n=1 Tax=Ornithinibacillus caprae TaxID=2678566 RepID=A0A6N8FJ28_9BACI|nr:GNAT family N-acetyltransferase [Ornithinibacillus caprae]MUK87977.1 GNAT family N-acetyltransferase [Ornithinibacillus caprae]